MIPFFAEGGHYTGSSGSSYSKMIWESNKKERAKQKTSNVMTAPCYPPGKQMKLNKHSGKIPF